MLRSYLRLDNIRNEEIRRRVQVDKDVLTFTEERRVTWYGHVRSFYKNRWIKKVTKWNPMGRRRRGRLRRLCTDKVDEAMDRRRLQDDD